MTLTNSKVQAMSAWQISFTPFPALSKTIMSHDIHSLMMMSGEIHGLTMMSHDIHGHISAHGLTLPCLFIRYCIFQEKQAKLDEVFGPMKPIPMDEYRHLYQMTGIDLDGRREFIVQEMPHIEQAIKHFISFAKTIPGFNELCIDDQIALIKCRNHMFYYLFWMMVDL